MPSNKDTQRGSILHTILTYAIELPRKNKSIMLIVADFVVSFLTLWFAIALRYGDFKTHVDLPTMVFYASLPIVLLILIHFYSHVVRVFQDESMRNVLLIFFGCLLLGQFLTHYDITPNVPQAAPAIHVFLLYIWIWNSRAVLQFLIFRILNPARFEQDRQKVVVYGVGSVAKDLIHVLRQTHEYQIVGIIDDRDTLAGSRVLGVKVYPNKHLPKLIDHLGAEHLFFAIPREMKQLKANVINQLADVPIKISQIPSLEDITTGKIKLTDIKPVDVLDVLERDTVEPTTDLLQKNIKNKIVMVTGAGGSIGSELCRQIIKQQPRVLVLFELSEFALYSIQQELLGAIRSIATQSNQPPIQLHVHLGSVTNQALIEKLCREYQVQTIYHAAAYKHVPIVEGNEYEGVMNNFVGTYRTVKAAINAGVETFVAISTDKAVRPTNVMGATKRMAELACQSLAVSQQTTVISMVRFGNVLGSSGSVVPLFNKQIAAGGPLTVTHPDVTRYFMTIPEAAQLVIQAGAMAKGGEVFVLDMGEPVKITDLARRMIRLSGFKVKGEAENPNTGIAIEFVGLRPGEKLYEELIIGGDNIDKTAHPLIMQARENYYDQAVIEAFLSNVIAHYDGAQDTDWLKAQFEIFVEGYKDRPLTPNH